jgi:hypothetical protein
MNRIKIAALLLTAAGVGLFAYFVYSIGLDEIRDGIARFSLLGFAIILGLYFIRICTRAAAWRLCTHEPYSLRMRDTVPAVMIGEALSSTVPLGILISGTSKAVAVRKRIPLVAGLSSVATENLFYSLVTGLFLISGAFVLLLGFGVGEGLRTALMGVISVLIVLILMGLVVVVKQWHFASEACEMLYRRGIARRWLDSGRHKVRLFENLVYGFYRRHPNRFLPVIAFEILYHTLGVAEVWIILTRVSTEIASPASAFLLESVSRLINIVFKLVPFLIGVDEAGARYVGEVIAVGAGTAVTLTIIRKGRILFWTAVGFALIIRRGLTFGEISRESSKMLDR